MNKDNRSFFKYINVLSDTAILFISVPLAFYFRFFVLSGSVNRISVIYYIIPSLIIIPVILFLYGILGVYDSIYHADIFKKIKKISIVNVGILSLIIMLLYLIKANDFSRAVLSLWISFSILFSWTKALFVKIFVNRKGLNIKNMVIIGSGAPAREYLSAISKNAELGFVARGYVSDNEESDMPKHLGGFDDLDKILSSIPCYGAVIALDAKDFYKINDIISICEKNGIKTSIIPFFSKYMSKQPNVETVGDLSLLSIRKVPLENYTCALIKRAMDIIGSLILIILTSPFMIFAAVGTRISSPGSVIFKQTRVGKDNKNFTMYKFRSMRINDESTTAWSKDVDPRKTKFGSFIRKVSIDELPQFFNVLKGDMSLIGPRPEIPHFVEEFKEKIPLYMVKHQVRPGITGWAQVNGLRGDTSIDERVKCDIWYIENWSIFLDIRILFMTVFKGLVNSEKIK